MSFETRARSAAVALRSTPAPDIEATLQRLHRTRRSRTAAAAVLAVAAIAAGAAVAGAQGREERTMPIAPTGDWVLVTGDHYVRTMSPGDGGSCRVATPGMGTDVEDPDVCGGRTNQHFNATWAAPLSASGVQTYEHYEDVDPATGRFLVKDAAHTGYLVMTPGQSDPVAVVPCRRDPQFRACWGASLGPGPDEVTVNNDRLLVIGPDGQVRRDLGTWWDPTPANPYQAVPAWSPDGEAWVETRTTTADDGARVEVVLVRADLRTVLLTDREEPPAWYGPDPRSESDLTGWGAPEVVDLEWSPDSTQVAFTTTSSTGTAADPAYRLRLYLADVASGTTDLLADLGEIRAVPLGVRSRPTAWRCACDNSYPDHWLPDSSIAWTPDGAGVTVLLQDALTTYDATTGAASGARPTDITGPIAWLRTSSPRG